MALEPTGTMGIPAPKVWGGVPENDRSRSRRAGTGPCGGWPPQVWAWGAEGTRYLGCGPSDNVPFAPQRSVIIKSKVPFHWPPSRPLGELAQSPFPELWTHEKHQITGLHLEPTPCCPRKAPPVVTQMEMETGLPPPSPLSETRFTVATAV